MITSNHRRFSIAPMMQYTHRWGRQFLRFFTPNALLYSQMHTANALHHGDKYAMLAFDIQEQPLACQLGGSDPYMLGEAALFAEQLGYQEININCGCPSDNVQAGEFGAVLMKNPHKVLKIVRHLTNILTVPVSIKCRIGVDEQEDDAFLDNFIMPLYEQAGVNIFHIHARKAILKGLSPRQNRTIPPIKYDRVMRLKQRLPDAHITVNGEITNLQQVMDFLTHIDGVMIGRAAFDNPWLLAEIERHLYQTPPPSYNDIFRRVRGLLHDALEQDVPYAMLHTIMIDMVKGLPNAKLFRQKITHKPLKPFASNALKQYDEAVEMLGLI